MKTFADRKHFALAVLAAVAFALAAPAHAVGARSHGLGGHDGHGAVGHDRSEGHHFDGRHFEGHDLDRRRFEGRGFGFVAPYYAPYYAAPSYWDYCPSYDAYYPDVSSCPEAWVVVPAP